jgi:DNA-binding NtrC family response regulator
MNIATGLSPSQKKERREKMENHADPAHVSPSNPSGLAGLIGNSDPMRCLWELVGKASQSDCPVLLLGETGTGKELVARAIHFGGSHRGKALVTVDCSALTPTLTESELFGHVRGSFTGADRPKVGLLQNANGGTIFLDEIGELPISSQAKLLRALQEKEIRPVGSLDRIQISGRVIAATNRDLEKGVRAGTFRQDLYFRLNVMQIKLPALREHKADIPLLAAHFLNKFSDPLHPVRDISEGALGLLKDYSWPGNIRELENTIECAVALSSSAILQVGDLPAKLHHAGVHPDPENNEPLSIYQIERLAIFRALERTGDDKFEASRLLGIGKTTLYRKLKEYSKTRKSA